jgi:methylmalonyl-CoA carboxyltransferase small subunit
MLQSPYKIVNPWSQQGRVVVRASHAMRPWNRPAEPRNRAGSAPLRLQIGVESGTYEVEVEILQEDSAPRGPVYGSYPAMPSTIQPTPVHGIEPQPNHLDDDLDEAKMCRSPVAGIVIRVNVQPGQQLHANDLMLVLEAMKMETNVTAPGTAVVKTIKV